MRSPPSPAIVVGAVFGRGRLGQVLEEDARKTIANSIAALVLVVSLVIILSARNEVIRQDLLVSTVAFMPKLVVGVVVVIAAFVLAKLAGVLAAQAMRSRSELLATRLQGAVSGAIMVVGLLLAVKQMGLETDVLMILVAGVVATATLAGGLSIGLGVVPLAKQISAGRHVEDRFQVGQLVEVAGVTGRIRAVHMASVEVVDEGGSRWEIPHISFLDAPVRIRRRLIPRSAVEPAPITIGTRRDEGESWSSRGEAFISVGSSILPLRNGPGNPSATTPTT